MYSEKVRAPWWVWLLAFFAAFSISVAIGAAFGGNSDLIALALSMALIGWLIYSSTVTIEVTDEYFRIDQAKLPRRFVGEVRALTKEETRRSRGPEADPACYMILRGWISTAVIVTNTDSDDPVPYWFVSTRKPQELAAALKS